MKKFFTLAAAVLASFSLWATTESNPTSATKDTDVAGTSYTIPGTYIAGSGSAKAGAMPDKGIKFRINKPAGDLKNAIEFKVNEGYVINAIQLVGITNTDNKAATVGSIYVDGAAWNGTFNGALPAKNAEAASDIQITGIAAAQSVVFVFSDLGDASQGNICYTVTYEEAVQKEVDHVVETLTGAAINGVALDETKMSTLLNNGEFEDLAYYVEAPTVTFTVQTDTYYVGEETPSTKSEKIDVVAELAAGMWTAQLTVNNETTYTVRATKPETRTITFMDGETVLGTEVVAKGDPSTKHANFETKPLAKFEGWFRNSDFTSQIDIETYTINEDQTLYGKFVKVYAQSLNFEQLVLDNGKGANIDSILTARGYEFSDINALDSLNDEKDNRNYPYLGLKLKKEGAYVGFNLHAASDMAFLRFGQISEPFVIEKNGNIDTINAQMANLTPESNQMVMYNDDNTDLHIRIRTLSGKTLVIKQIMINEEIATVTLPEAPVVEPTLYTVTLNEPVNGTLGFAMTGADGKFAEGDTVRLSVVPDDNYFIDEVTAVGSKIETDAINVQATTDGTYYFVMPADDVTVEAVFEEFVPVTVTYTVTLAEAEHGTLSFALVGATGEFAEDADVPVLATPEDGYKVGQVTVDEQVLTADGQGVYHFTMPGYDVTVTATFVPESEGIEDVNAAGKTVKRLENGILVIKKGGMQYNAQGNVVK